MKRNEGFVLILTLMMMVVIMILVFGTAYTTVIDRQVSANQQGAADSYYIAQSGLQRYKTQVFRNLIQYYNDNPSGEWCVNPVAGGITGGGEGTLTPGGPSIITAFGGGEYEVSYDNNANYITLTSVGRIGNSRSTVQLVATIGGGTAGAWDNAIFATGQEDNTPAINGNVSVYGSVHVVKGDLDVANENLSLGGTAGVYNDYRGASGQANSDISTTMGTLFGVDYSQPSNQPDLCTKIKLERGDLILESSGNNSSQIGATDIPIYSIHMGQGIVKHKNSDAALENHQTEAQINLKYPEGAGMNSGYEGYAVDFPLLPADYPNDRGFNVTIADPNCAWLFNTTTNPPYIDISAARLGTAAKPICGDSGTGDTITWKQDVATGQFHLEIGGTINTGTYDVKITGPVSYRGKGSIRAGRCLDAPGSTNPGCTTPEPNPPYSNQNNRKFDIAVEGTLKPLEGDYLEDTAEGDYLGLVASGDIHLTDQPGGSTSAAIAAMAYAGGEIRLSKQPIVAGALVSDAFSIGSQVPKVAYHKGVSDAAGKLCLPGSYDLAFGCTVGVGPLGEDGDPATPGDTQPLSDVSFERR